MNLNLVIPSLAAGGAERVLTTLANHWARRGDRVTVFTTHDGGSAPHYELHSDVRLVSLRAALPAPLRNLAIVSALRREFRDAPPDLVISFLNYTNVLALVANSGRQCPIVVSERLDPRVIGIGPIWSLLRRLTYRNATRLVAQTPTAAGLFEYLAPGRTVVIPNPVPPPAIGTSPLPEWPIHERPTVIAVGRLMPQKGFDIALRAFSLLPATCAEWQFIILGEGPQRATLERLRDELGLTNRVYMPGRVADPTPWLQRAGIFLMSSRSEGFPNALAEAMAVGLPVLSTDCPSGPSDLITHGVDGMLVATEDPRAMALALGELMVSSDLRERLASAAPHVLDRFSQTSVLNAWDTLLAELVTSRPIQGPSRTDSRR